MSNKGGIFLLKWKTIGITLIALVITIIVLLILSTISINMLTGENGLLSKTEEAKSKTEKEGEVEKVKLAIMGSFSTVCMEKRPKHFL